MSERDPSLAALCVPDGDARRSPCTARMSATSVEGRCCSPSWVPWWGPSSRRSHGPPHRSLPTFAAAILGVASGVAATAALHLDGLGDVADGIGASLGGREPREAMRDPRLGTFGIAAVALDLLLKASLLSALVVAGFPWGGRGRRVDLAGGADRDGLATALRRRRIRRVDGRHRRRDGGGGARHRARDLRSRLPGSRRRPWRSRSPSSRWCSDGGRDGVSVARPATFSGPPSSSARPSRSWPRSPLADGRGRRRDEAAGRLGASGGSSNRQVYAARRGSAGCESSSEAS